MGSLFSNGKNEYFWRFLASLSPDVYQTDKSVVPYTPDYLQVYTDFFPDQFVVFPLTTLYVWIDGSQVGSAPISTADGFFYVAIQVPQGNFDLQIKTADGTVLRSENYNAKNYALVFDVAAQSYEERRISIEQTKNDVSYATMRTGRIPAIVGPFFDFLPPPGWDSEKYREAVLGGCGDGFIKSFLNGATQGGILETVKSITCVDAEMSSVQDGKRWVIFDSAFAPDPLDVNDPDAWFLSDAVLPAENQQIFVLDPYYVAYGIHLKVNGSTLAIVDESVVKRSNSFIQSRLAEPFNLVDKSLTFWVRNPDNRYADLSYTTTFAYATTAQEAADEILAQNPSLATTPLPIYGVDGFLRIGVPPMQDGTWRLEVYSGSALSVFGWTSGQTADVIPDVLANPYATTAVVLTYGANTYTQGVDFDYVTETGEIVWKPSSAAFPNVPPLGATFLASYTYQMRREIMAMVDRVKEPQTAIEYEWA